MNFSFETAAKDEDETLSSIIENGSQLELGYLPDKILHREEQIEKLRDQFFQSVYVDDLTQQALLVGPPGTGKTATVRWVKQRVEQGNDSDRVKIVYVNCENRSSKQDVYKSIMNQLGVKFERGYGIDYNLDKLLSEINGESKDSNPIHLITILDELDALNKTNYINKVLYTLTDPSGIYDQGEFNAKISVMAISNDEKITRYFNDSVNSRYQRTDIRFDRYSVDQIADILSKRQQKAFTSEILDREALTVLAKNVKERFESDVRAGINVLKSIPNHLNRKQGIDPTQENQVELVQEAIQEVQRSKLNEIIREHNQHFTLLLEALVQRLDMEEKRLDDINQSYRKACEAASIDKNGGEDSTQIKSKTYVHRRLDELVVRNILEKEKRYDKDQNPYFYNSLIDIDLIEEVVLEELERKGLEKRMMESKERTKNQAEEILSSHMGQD